MTDSNTTERLLPLRLSWPKKPAVVKLCDERRGEFTRACAQLKQIVPDCGCATVDKLGREVAMSLANGFLSSVVDQAESGPADLDRFPAEAPALANESWLCDVFLVAGCIRNDSGANRALMSLIQDEVSPKIERRFSSNPRVVDEVTSNLPSHLRLPTEEGFNRGRPRLAQFYGRSTLKTWLRTVAMNMGLDLVAKFKQHGMGSLDESTTDVVAKAGPSDASSKAQLIAELESSLQSAFNKLLQLLSDQKKRQPSFKQYDYALLCLVQGRSPTEAAERLGVGQPRVTELAGAVHNKLVDLLIAEDPRWEQLTAGEPSAADADRKAAATENRKLLVKWLRKLIDPAAAGDPPSGSAQEPDDE